MSAARGVLPIIAVAGPTGSGKTALAIALAERLDTEIVSADSMQFYRGMEIGTAAPAKRERQRVKHHFVACLPPDAAMDASEYQEKARAVVLRLNAAGKTAVVAGGSGLYVGALLDGIFEGPGRDQGIRDRLKAEAAEKGNAHMMARLAAVDPDYAASITSENDLIRIVRALEVHEMSGTPYSVLHAAHRAAGGGLEAVRVAFQYERAVLYARVERRVDAMFSAGWVEEVQALVAGGHKEHLLRLKALGYREIVAHLEGKQSRDAVITVIKQHHRRYAKRQLTWFRADARIHWLSAAPERALEDYVAETLALDARLRR